MRKVLVGALLLSGASVMASDYLTNGGDPGRTGWMKDEKVFTVANVQDMKLSGRSLEARLAMHNLFNPLVAGA
jgi:hypothetical protein